METSKREPNYLLCPKCGKATALPSQRRKRWDFLMRLLGRVPMRCQRCRHRFFVPAAKVPKSTEKK